MSDSHTLTERCSNWFFSIPTVAQWWAKREAAKIAGESTDGLQIPFARLEKPLAKCTAALVTTGGIHLVDQEPFDMDTPDGDPSYREIPNDVALDRITITHKYYDHSDVDRDLNVMFPLDHFRSLVKEDILDSLSRRHFSFMGHIDGPLVDRLKYDTAPEVAGKLRADGVDFAFLTPA